MSWRRNGTRRCCLYVVDLQFVDRTVGADVVNTEQKLTEIGRPQLLSAKERAAEHGVATEAIIRTGEMRKEVKNTPRKEGISLVVQGQPAGEESVLELGDLEAIANEIEDEASVEACIV